MAFTLSRVIQTVDSHTEGNPTRVIVGGVPPPPGRSVADKSRWLERNNDSLRRLLNFEPRGGGMMCAVLLMPPVDGDGDFAAIIMEQDNYVPMSGHCIIGAATTVVATGMVPAVAPVTTVRFETPAGLVACDVATEDGKTTSVSFTNVESFLLHRAAKISTRRFGGLEVDIAYGGDFYAVVDADALGLDLDAANEAALIAAAAEIRPAVQSQLSVRHPDRADIDRCYMVHFLSRKTRAGGALRGTVVCPPGALDRSPCGTGTSAQVARLVTLGQLKIGERLRLEGPLSTYFDGEAVAAEERDGLLRVTPRITGRAYITGFHSFVLDPDDPFPAGYRIGTVS
jgi:proline racemase